MSAQVLRQRLRGRGLLESVDAGRQMLTVRRTLGGRTHQVLHLRANVLLNPIGKSQRADNRESMVGFVIGAANFISSSRYGRY